MKRIRFFGIILTLLLVIVACDIGPMSIDFGIGGDGDSSQTQGGAIEAGIDSPANGATLKMEPIEIAYHATSTEGVASVELSINGEVVSPYTSPDTSQKVVALNYTWEPKVSGSHTIRVRAQNSKGVWSDFSAATVNVEDGEEDSPSESDQPDEEEELTPTKTPEDLTIFNVKHNPDKFYYGDGTCGSLEVTISADITHPDEAYAATLFTRIYDNDGGGGLTKWDSGRGMGRKTDTHFSATLISNNIPNYNSYRHAVVHYQIVVTDKNDNRLIATDVIKKLLLERCP